jgi:N-methylhydantoinase B
MDVRFVKPFFYKGEMLLARQHRPLARHRRDGARRLLGERHRGRAGGAAPAAGEALQAGVLDPEIYAIIISNIRVADQRIGDIKAQAAALTSAARRLTALLDRYGAHGRGRDRRAARAPRQMRAKIAAIPDGVYAAGLGRFRRRGRRAAAIVSPSRRRATDLTFDLTGSSPPCRRPDEQRHRHHAVSIYLAIKHIFPDVPISAGAFEPLTSSSPRAPSSTPKYPRPVSGCAAEVSPAHRRGGLRALVQALPDLLTAAPAGTSGNFALGGTIRREPHYVMYLITGGGYGGNAGDGLSNGCSTIGISKSPPVEVMEQFYPVLFEDYALREGSGGAGEHRGGFGLAYA